MDIRVMQSNVGQYNVFGNEPSYEFGIGINDNEGKLIEENGTRAVLKFSGEPEDQDDFVDPIENLGEVFTKCFEYGQSVISSTDYVAQCILFSKVYHENYEQLHQDIRERNIVKFEKEIKLLQFIIDDPTEGGITDISWNVNQALDNRIKHDQRMVDTYSNKKAQFKKKSDGYKENERYLEKYLKRINDLNHCKSIAVEHGI